MPTNKVKLHTCLWQTNRLFFNKIKFPDDSWGKIKFTLWRRKESASAEPHILNLGICLGRSDALHVGSFAHWLAVWLQYKHSNKLAKDELTVTNELHVVAPSLLVNSDYRSVAEGTLAWNVTPPVPSYCLPRLFFGWPWNNFYTAAMTTVRNYVCIRS